jgi:hypothetical protein
VTTGELLTLSTLNFTEAAENLTRANQQLCTSLNCTQASVDSSGRVSLAWAGVSTSQSQEFCLNASSASSATFFSFDNFPANFSGAIVINLLVLLATPPTDMDGYRG